MRTLTIKQATVNGSRRKVLRWPDGDVPLTWSLLLTKVQEEFSICRQDIQLSLNYGKTCIEATPECSLSELGIVNGDIMTLISSPATPMEAPATCREAPATPMETQKTADKKVKLEEDIDASQSDMSVADEIAAGGMMVADPGMVNRFLNLPLLLRDVRDENLPPSFHQLLVEHAKSAPVDQLALALHTLLLESGFIYVAKVNKQGSLLKQIRLSPSLYKMTYSHMFHEDSNVAVASVLMGNQLAVHAVVKPSGNLSVTLSTKQYVGKDGLLKSKLTQLSNHFKDAMVAPLILVMKEALNMPAPPPVLDLPYELLVAVFSKLDFKSVCRLGSTCKQLSRVYRDNSLWKRLYLQRFNKLSYGCDTAEEYYWYQQYKKRSLSSKARRLVNVQQLEYYPPVPFYYPFIHPGHHLPPPIRDDPANQHIPVPHEVPPIGNAAHILGHGLAAPHRYPQRRRNDQT